MAAVFLFKDSTVLCCTITSDHICCQLLLLHYSLRAHFISKRKPPASLCSPVPAHFHLSQLQFMNQSSTAGIRCFSGSLHLRLAKASQSVNECIAGKEATLIFFFFFGFEASRSFLWVLPPRQTQLGGTSSQKFQADIRADRAAASSLLSRVLHL